MAKNNYFYQSTHFMQNLLLLHGAIGAKDQFNPLVEKLNGDFQIHNLNFSGHGGEPIPENYSIPQFAKDVLAYLEQNHIATIDIFGYSMGGYVALYLAKHHPEKVGRIFTLATKFHWTPDIAWRETKMLDPEKISEKIPAFAEQLQKRHEPADWKQVMRKTADMMLAMGEDNPLKPNDYTTITQRVRIGIGDKDAMVTLEETIETYRKLQQASLIVFPDTPHPVEKVDLERLAREISGFFK